MENTELHNPQFNGSPFFLEAGSTGVLLMHGYTATPWEVRRFAEILHAQDYTVAGPLLAGHGTKLEDLNKVRWQDWVQSGETYYQKLKEKCRHVFVGGASTGGLAALYLASEHPEIAGVLCYVPAIKLTLPKTTQVVLRLTAPFIPQIGRASLDCADLWQGYPGLPLKGAVQLLNFQSAVIDRLASIKSPIIVFQGRLDTTVHPDAGDIILNGVQSPLKEHHWMEHSTHEITLDQEQDQVAQITVAFMNKALS